MLLIPGRDDVGLDRIVRRIGRVARCHHPFEEGSDGFIAVVAAGSQHDGPFQVHGRIATPVRLRAAVPGGQGARLRVAPLDGVFVLPIVLDEGRDERAVIALIIEIGPISSGKESVFQIGLYPGTRAGTRPEPALGAEVDRVHVAATVGSVIGLGVAVVEAALIVDMSAAGHHVHPLRSTILCHSRGGVVPIAHASCHVESIDLMTPDREWERGSVGTVILPTMLARSFDGEVVVPRRLVVDHRDNT